MVNFITPLIRVAVLSWQQVTRSHGSASLEWFNLVQMDETRAPAGSRLERGAYEVFLPAVTQKSETFCSAHLNFHYVRNTAPF